MSLTLFAVKSIINHYETVLRRNRMYISVSDAAKSLECQKEEFKLYVSKVELRVQAGLAEYG